jgi:hypothetical protein
MRDYSCFVYHLQNKKLIQNNNQACWNGLNMKIYIDENYNNIILDDKTKDYIYIDKYIEKEITDKQRKRIIYLINKITPCKFTKIDDKIYIQYKLLKNYYSNLLLLNFIRILWYQNQSFNNEQFFVDICKSKLKNLDYLEFMMTCIKNNVNTESSWYYGDHSFVYLGIIPKTKEILYKYTGISMSNFLQLKIEDIK